MEISKRQIQNIQNIPKITLTADDIGAILDNLTVDQIQDYLESRTHNTISILDKPKSFQGRTYRVVDADGTVVDFDGEPVVSDFVHMWAVVDGSDFNFKTVDRIKNYKGDWKKSLQILD